MATLRVTYWRDIPLLVTARDETGEVTVALDPGFQELVDRVAIQEGLSEGDAYLEAWRVGPEEAHPGTAASTAAAHAVALGTGLAMFCARYLDAPGRASPG